LLLLLLLRRRVVGRSRTTMCGWRSAVSHE
jgi:hypothetical protein